MSRATATKQALVDWWKTKGGAIDVPKYLLDELDKLIRADEAHELRARADGATQGLTELQVWMMKEVGTTDTRAASAELLRQRKASKLFSIEPHNCPLPKRP